jgi:hypothetical protein
MRSGLVLLFTAVFFALALCGCSRKSFEESEVEETTEEAGTPGKAASVRPLSPSTEADRELAELEESIARSPRDLEGIATQAAELKSKYPSYASKIDSLLARAQQNFDREAEKIFLETKQEAERLKDEGKLGEAFAVLGNYPVEFRKTLWQKEIEELAKPFEPLVNAESKFNQTESAVRAAESAGDIDRAFELVNEFPENLRVGEWQSKWKNLSDDIAAKKKASDEQKDKERAVPWETLFDGTNLDRWSPGDESGWELKDATMVGKHSGSGFAEIHAVAKEGEWDSFILEFEFKIASGDYLTVGIRGKPVEGGTLYQQIDFPALRYKSGTWFKVRIEARGENISVIDLNTNEKRTEEAESEYTKGPISFFASGDCEVHVKNVRIKHLK